MSLRPTSPPIRLGPTGNSPAPIPGYAAADLLLTAVPVQGVLQVETLTAAGTATATGTAQVTVTGALLAAPVVIPVAIANTDNATAIGGKIRAAVQASGPVTTYYTVGGSTTTTTLTPKIGAANDASLNIAVATGTATGVTAVPTSTNTTAGVLGTDGVIGQGAIVPSDSTGSKVWKLVSKDPTLWVALG